MNYTKKQIAEIANTLAFSLPDITGLSGHNEDDEMIYCEEYACGISIFGLLTKLGVKISDFDPATVTLLGQSS